MKRNNYVVNRIKPDNEQIYYIIDAINDAINAGKQISFQYYDYTGLKKKVLKNKGEVYKLSPYKLLWCGDYYYVLGYSEKKSKVINFRVDRIASKPEILDNNVNSKLLKCCNVFRNSSSMCRYSIFIILHCNVEFLTSFSTTSHRLSRFHCNVVHRG